MLGIRQILLASILVLSPVQYALADPFNDGDSPGEFHSHLDDFNKSLDNVGQQMRNDHDYTTIQQSQRTFADQQAVQSGTQAQAQESFMNGQTQAANGGATGYGNNYGSFGLFGGMGLPGIGQGGFSSGIGSFGIGNNVNTVGAAQTPASSATTTGNFNTNGGVDYDTAYKNGFNAGLKHGSKTTKNDPFESFKKPTSPAPSSKNSTFSSTLNKL